MSIANLLIHALATFYLTHAVTWSFGPFNIFKRLRERYPLGGLMTCGYCLSLWVALLLWLLLKTPLRPLVQVLAAAGTSAAVGQFLGLESE